MDNVKKLGLIGSIVTFLGINLTVGSIFIVILTNGAALLLGNLFLYGIFMDMIGAGILVLWVIAYILKSIKH